LSIAYILWLQEASGSLFTQPLGPYIMPQSWKIQSRNSHW